MTKASRLLEPARRDRRPAETLACADRERLRA